MSTIYYGKGPLLFKTESALMNYLNQQPTNNVESVNASDNHISRVSLSNTILGILLIGGGILLVIYILKSTSDQNKEKMPKTISTP